MALPDLKLEIAFDSGFSTPEGSRTWTDVSNYVEGESSVEITYGRADELTTPDPNTLTVTLDNSDGRFTPKKSLLVNGSPNPYYPNVKKGKPIRLTVTYNSVAYVRFTGYINQWPVVWPQGTGAQASVTITATSRRARLGQTAPLTSAIRAAYLATGPEAYWPMDETEDIRARGGQQVFRDITNNDPHGHAQNIIAAFTTSDALTPIVNDGTAGPTDEASLVHFPRFTDSTLVGALAHYVGGGQVISVNTTGGYVTTEVVARVSPRVGNTNIGLIGLFDAGMFQRFDLSIADKRAFDNGAAVAGNFLVRDPDTFALLENEGAGADLVDIACDGQIHHYAFVLDSAGTVGKVYFDGALIGTLSIANAITNRLTQVVIGSDSYNADVWIGHAAITDRALTDAEVLAHAQAATAASETVEDRVVRVAGRLGVPSGEIDVETSIAADLGPQPEAGRSAAEVLDEAATSSGSVFYDARNGHLALQARNHRYNLAVAFTLSAALHEIESDLTITDDHRYTINTVEFTQSGTDDVPSTLVDQDSIDEYGVFAQSYQVVSSSPTEVETFAQDRLYRYADPDPRVSTVSVDLVNLSDSQRAAVLTADIGTRFGIGSLAGQAPSDPMHLFLEGYSESITATSHTMAVNSTPGDLYQSVLVLDDASLGLLDSANVLAY